MRGTPLANAVQAAPSSLWIERASRHDQVDILTGILESFRPGARLPMRDREAIGDHVRAMVKVGRLEPPAAAIAATILEKLPGPQPQRPR